ncbi:hypothetical protein Bbelb_072470 [Branchiostoma belcheri]|nr:hypothetical protein Bbelb_072470 [Branchiostoma belcheri]
MVSASTLGPAEITFGASAGFELGFEFNMELGWSSPFVQQAGARFFGSAELSVSASASISASVSRSWSRMLKEGNIRSFCIPIWGPICLPAKLRYEIPAELEVFASVEFEISFAATASASASMGVSWSSGRGLTPRFDTDFDIDLSKDATTTAEGRAELTGTITPTLLLDVPAPGLPINIPIPRWLLPRFIKRLLGFSSSGRSAITLMSPSVEMPIVGSVWGEFCLEGLTPVMKLLGYKAGIDEITAGVEVGVGDFQAGVEVSIPIPGSIEGEENFRDCGQNPPVNPPPATNAPPPTPDKPTTIPDEPTTIPDAQTTPEAPTTTPDETCTIELVFLLDGSWSIGPINFEEMKEYIRDVIACLNITNTKVSVIRYDEKPMTYITLGGYTSITHLQYLIMYVSFQGSLTKTGHAIRYMATVVPFDSSVHKAAVVVTDGRNLVPTVLEVPTSSGKIPQFKLLATGMLTKQDGYAESASEARNAGIELFCIAAGIDVFINYDELNIITDNPARVVDWKQVDPCEFAVLLLTELCGDCVHNGSVVSHDSFFLDGGDICYCIYQQVSCGLFHDWCMYGGNYYPPGSLISSNTYSDGCTTSVSCSHGGACTAIKLPKIRAVPAIMLAVPGNSCGTGYKMLAVLGNSCGTGYKMLAVPENSCGTGYKMLAVLGNSCGTGYKMLAVLGNSCGTGYKMLAVPGNSCGTGYKMLAVPGNSCGTSYKMLAVPENSCGTGYKMLAVPGIVKIAPSLENTSAISNTPLEQSGPLLRTDQRPKCSQDWARFVGKSCKVPFARAQRRAPVSIEPGTSRFRVQRFNRCATDAKRRAFRVTTHRGYWNNVLVCRHVGACVCAQLDGGGMATPLLGQSSLVQADNESAASSIPGGVRMECTAAASSTSCQVGGNFYPAGSTISEGTDQCGCTYGTYCDEDFGVIHGDCFQHCCIHEGNVIDHGDSYTDSSGRQCLCEFGQALCIVVKPGCQMGDSFYPLGSTISEGTDQCGCTYGTYCTQDGHIVTTDCSSTCILSG